VNRKRLLFTDLLQSKDVVTILPKGFEESLMYQLCAMAKEMQMVRMLLFLYFATQKLQERSNKRDERA